MRLPLLSMISAPLSWRSTASTVSPRRKTTPRSRSESCSARTISESQNGSSSRRVSMTVTFVPTAANIDAYSMPITPAPTTTSDCGISLEVEDAVRVEDRLLVELDARGPHGPAAGRDHDAVRIDHLAAAVVRA